MRIREAQQADAAALAQVLIETTRRAFRPFIPLETLLAFTPAESERNWARKLREIHESDHAREFIYVAQTDSGAVIGLALGGPERTGHPHYLGEVLVLAVLPAYQHRGVGRRLVETVVERLTHQALVPFLIRVVAPNAPARRFYEALGGQLVPDVHEQITDDGTLLDQIAYSWRDAQQLTARARTTEEGCRGDVEDLMTVRRAARQAEVPTHRIYGWLRQGRLAAQPARHGQLVSLTAVCDVATDTAPPPLRRPDRGP